MEQTDGRTPDRYMKLTTRATTLVSLRRATLKSTASLPHSFSSTALQLVFPASFSLVNESIASIAYNETLFILRQ